ncbi:MAG: transglutaminase domain-containing protein [Burkholderiaceae bacterium]|nr:transglutaminase domain-containing protein [Burkholderiaceae bacterium]
MTCSRRAILRGAGTAAAAWLLPEANASGERRFEPRAGAWRTFETTTEVTVIDQQGATRLWLPVPGVETGYQRSLWNAWSGNAASVRMVVDPTFAVRMLHASFPSSVRRPTLRVVSRFQTRDRSVDWQRPVYAREDPRILHDCVQPTEWMPIDGIVRETALAATRGATDDLARARRIYRWVIARAHREPTVRGCGTGDVRTMLETGNLGGKCADLNAVFVALCRAVGIPARDVYGLRLAPSAFGYRELGADPTKLTGAQHCRAEVFLRRYGWVAMDPADVLKVMRQETKEWIRDPSHSIRARELGKA